MNMLIHVNIDDCSVAKSKQSGAVVRACATNGGHTQIE